jgi:hypothetical protein
MFHLYQFASLQEHLRLSVVQSQISRGQFAERSQLNIAYVCLLAFREAVEEESSITSAQRNYSAVAARAPFSLPRHALFDQAASQRRIDHTLIRALNCFTQRLLGNVAFAYQPREGFRPEDSQAFPITL